MSWDGNTLWDGNTPWALAVGDVLPGQSQPAWDGNTLWDGNTPWALAVGDVLPGQSQPAWDGNTLWDSNTPWALGVGEDAGAPVVLAASGDAMALVDTGGAALFAAQLAGAADVVELLDAGGAALFVVDLAGVADVVMLLDAGGSAHVPAPPVGPTTGYDERAAGRLWDASSLQRVVKAWPPKLPAERVVALFDFAPDLQAGDAVASCTVTVSVVHGADPAAAAVVAAAPAIKGRRVLQALDAGVGGCVYLVQCQATTRQGSVLVLARLLPVATLTIH